VRRDVAADDNGKSVRKYFRDTTIASLPTLYSVSCSALSTCSQCIAHRHCRYCGVTCIDYANSCPAQPDLVAGDVCSAQFDVTVATPPSTAITITTTTITITDISTAVGTTTVAALDPCESLPREEREEAASAGCKWNNVTTAGVCVCYTATGCRESITASIGTFTAANNSTAIVLCIAQDTLLLDAPCGNETVGLLAIGERVLLIATVRADECSSSSVHVRRQQASGEKGYVASSALTSECERYAVADDDGTSAMTVYALAAVLAVVVVVGAVAAAACVIVRRRRRRATAVDGGGEVQPPAVSPYGEIPPTRAASPCGERVSVAASPSPYADLSATEIGK